MSNLTNERYISDVTPELFRDFLLRAAVSGARVGYDTSGDMWAVVDESDPTLPEVTFTAGDSSIFANEGVAMPGGNFLEWKQQRLDRGGRGAQIPRFTLGEIPFALICQDEKWFVDEAEAEFYDNPTVPANRIEQMAWESSFDAAKWSFPHNRTDVPGQGVEIVEQ